jgi:hypothetical protein
VHDSQSGRKPQFSRQILVNQDAVHATSRMTKWCFMRRLKNRTTSRTSSSVKAG